MRELTLNEMKRSVRAWTGSPEGAEKLRITQEATKSVVKKIRDATLVDPVLLRQPVTI